MSITMTLAYKTPKKWLTSATKKFDVLLHNQADIERKSAALALYLVSKYPQYEKVVGGLIEISIAKLRHFGDLYSVMQSRKVALERELGSDLYSSRILAQCRLGRKERYLDRMLVNAAVLSRDNERYGMLLEKVDDKKLDTLYKRIIKDNTELIDQYLTLATHYFKKDEVAARVPEIMAIEAEIIQQSEEGSLMH